MCRTDCGRCIDCIESDDYAPTWRNPRFEAPVSAVEAPKALGDVGGAARPSAPVLGRDGGERPTVERIDKHTVRVDGIDVVAGPETESRLRQMDAEQRRMFARIMQADR